MRIGELVRFMEARHDIYRRRSALIPKPWTNDPILLSYRFCNVYRQLDTETIWISDHWLKPHIAHDDLWFAMLVARTINWSPTLKDLGWPVPFALGHFLGTLQRRSMERQKVWTGAYMITTHKKPIPKEIYYGNMLDEAWSRRKKLRPTHMDTLASYHEKLMSIDGVGSFIAGQVIADLKYSERSPLAGASDWKTWSAPGTGSIRGMNRVLDRPLKYGIDHQMWIDTMKLLMAGLAARIERSRILPDMPDAQDVQNCLCEFDKYERVRLNQGRPRSTYNGHN